MPDIDDTWHLKWRCPYCEEVVRRDIAPDGKTFANDYEGRVSADVVQLYESNRRDPVATLRHIANEIEAGKYGDVGTIALALLGDQLEIFGMGRDSERPSIGVVFQAASLRIAKAIEEHGKLPC